ncbi:MAG: caspase family protein [Sphingomonas adhaesiva]|uniref:caspase family protein n=1 Tax=Sphingomonas adhaesiva TaxID=28212 RepID=UPI002FF50B99
MTLVLDRERGELRSTHAIVIGVGAYPWLPGGDKAGDPELAEGMGQLESPPRSARAFATWLIDHHHDPQAPLDTVELLVSERVPEPFVRSDGVSFDVERSVKALITAALTRWRDRGNLADGNALIFYFCGHGVLANPKLMLLAADFASNDELPYNDAFWLEGLREGMLKNRATRQVFFVDACRVASGRLLKEYTSPLDPVFSARAPYTPGLANATYYATTSGRPAYGRPGDVSLFTAFLLRALDGMAADDDDGPWRVETTKIQRVLGDLSTRLALPEHYGLQTPVGGDQTSFGFHWPKHAPKVPFFLRQADEDDDGVPPGRIRQVSVEPEGGPPSVWPHPWEKSAVCSWEAGRFRSDQQAGMSYSWSVTYDDGTVMTSRPKTLNPPYRQVEFPRDGVA